MFQNRRSKGFLSLGQPSGHLLFKAVFECLRFQLFLDFRKHGGKVELINKIGRQTLPVPFCGRSFVRAERRDNILNHLIKNRVNRFAHILTRKDFLALTIDDFALTIHDIVIINQVFTNFKVVRFNLLLCPFNRLGNHTMLNRLVFGHLELFHNERNAMRAKDAQQIIFKAHVKTALTRITLATGTTTQLVINTTRFVPFGTKDVQAARVKDLLLLGRTESFILFHCLVKRLLRVCGSLSLTPGHHLRIAAQDNIGTTPGHVGCNRKRPLAARLSDNFSFPLMLLGVQYIMLNATLLQKFREDLRVFNGDGANQDRLTGFMPANDVFNNRVKFFLAGFVDDIGLINTNHRLVRRHNDNFKTINFIEFCRFGIRRTGHAGQLFVHTEIVLESNRRQSLIFFLDFQTLFCFDRLVLAITPAPTRHQTPSKFINYHHLAILDHVINITLKDGMGS